MRRVFFPQWNLAFEDADFYKCNPKNAITIEVVLGNIPDDFYDLGKYGHWLCGWNSVKLQREDDPGEGLEEALWVRLRIMENLEPSWSVIKNDGDDGVSFKWNDRAKAAVSLIGVVSDIAI